MLDYYIKKIFEIKENSRFSDSMHTILLETNPALWFVLIYLFILLSIAFSFKDVFRFEKANLFTLVWTGVLLLLVHTICNYKNYKALSRIKSKRFITATYVHALYNYMPYLIIAAVYDNLVLFSDAFKKYFHNLDYYFMKADGVIFGFQPVFFLERYLDPFAVEFFMIAYGLYFVYPYCYILYLYQKNQLPLVHKVILGQILILMISFICYITLPAYGPRFASNPEHPYYQKDIPAFSAQIKGVNINMLRELTGKESPYQLQFDLWNSLERIKTDCMPSMHACLCIFCLIYALKSRAIYKWKKTAVLFWIIGVSSLVFSTVYLRYHWAIDVIVGSAFAVAAYFPTEYLYKIWLQYRKKNGLELPEVTWLTEAKKLRGMT